MNSPGDSGSAGDGVKPAGCPLSEPLRHFIDSCGWTFAKTYADTWPHEYIVRKNVDDDLFVRLVGHIREHGYEGRFYRMLITYFEEGGLVYWTMGAPIEITTIVNRCKKEFTYEARLRNGTLPETRKGTEPKGKQQGSAPIAK